MRGFMIGAMLVLGGCATTSARDAAVRARLDAIEARQHAADEKLDRLAAAARATPAKTERTTTATERATPATDDRIDIPVNGQRVLAAERVANYTVGAPDVVQVKVTPDGRHLVLLGAKPGYTGLLLFDGDGTLHNYDVHVGAPSRDTGAARIDLVVGGLRVLPSAGVTNFATGSDVVQIKSFENGNKLVLDAVKAGYTGLTLIYADGHVDNYDVRVAPSAQ